MNKYNKEPGGISLQEYVDSVMNDPKQGMLYKEQIILDFNEYKKQLEDLLAKRIKPSSVVGTGYKNPRKAAIEWLEQCIAEYQSIINGTATHSVIKANYEYHLRTRSRISHETNTQEAHRR